MPGPPGILQVEEIRDSSIKLAWSKGGDHNSPILYYTIQTRHFWALNEDDWRVATTCECSVPPLRGDIASENADMRCYQLNIGTNFQQNIILVRFE